MNGNDEAKPGLKMTIPSTSRRLISKKEKKAISIFGHFFFIFSFRGKS